MYDDDFIKAETDCLLACCYVAAFIIAIAVAGLLAL